MTPAARDHTNASRVANQTVAVLAAVGQDVTVLCAVVVHERVLN